MKSLSNMIKAYSIRYEDDKKTIDTHLRIDKELEEKRKIAIQAATQPQADNGFVEGLQALVIDPSPGQAEELTEIAARHLEEAKQEAKSILEQAKKEAEALKKDAVNAAQKKGYDEGMLQSKKELQKLKAEYEDKTRQLQEEYEAMALSFEPQMADIIASLVEKITGIVVKDRDEVILYLVDKALRNLDKSEEYTIRVSKEDYEYISMRKTHLLNAIGREISLYITEDSNLRKDQCLIETELKVINCSLDVQLNNLIMDLKLLAGI